MGGERGEGRKVHQRHVNMGQCPTTCSTRDATVAAVEAPARPAVTAVRRVRERGQEAEDPGYCQDPGALMDGRDTMTMGQEILGGSAPRQLAPRARRGVDPHLCEVALGGATAVVTGLNAAPRGSRCGWRELARTDRPPRRHGAQQGRGHSPGTTHDCSPTARSRTLAGPLIEDRQDVRLDGYPVP